MEIVGTKGTWVFFHGLEMATMERESACPKALLRAGCDPNRRSRFPGPGTEGVYWMEGKSSPCPRRNRGYIPGGASIDPQIHSNRNISFKPMPPGVTHYQVPWCQPRQKLSSSYPCLSLCHFLWGSRVRPRSRGQRGMVRSSDIVKDEEANHALFSYSIRAVQLKLRKRGFERDLEFWLWRMTQQFTGMRLLLGLLVTTELFIIHEWAAWNFIKDSDECSRVGGMGGKRTRLSSHCLL